MPLVLELQRKATDQKTPLSELLRTAKLVASKLKLTEDTKWIDAELDGYRVTDFSDLPSYRVIYGDVRAHNPVNGLLIPIRFGDAEVAKAFERVPVGDSVAALEGLVSGGGEYLIFRCTPAQANYIRKGQRADWIDPFRKIGHSQVKGILDSVRTRVLNWAIELESKGILGDDMTFSPSELEKAQTMSQQIHIASFQGVLGNVQGGNVAINNFDAVHAS
jgi:hypothetical protein